MFQIHIPDTPPNPLNPFAGQMSGTYPQITVVQPTTIAPFTTPDLGTLIPNPLKPFSDALTNAQTGIDNLRQKIADNEVNIITGIAGFLILSVGVASIAGREI